MTRRARVDREIAVVRELVTEVATWLSAEQHQEVDELLRHDEPNEALLVIAWALPANPNAVPQGISRTIREAVGDANDLPPNLRDGVTDTKAP